MFVGKSTWSGLGQEGDKPLTSKEIKEEFGGQWAGGPIAKIPIVGGIVPMITGLIVKIPVVGKVFKKIFGGKATHMESCMKWFTDSNIMGIAGNTVTPISTIALVYVSDDPARMAKYKSDLEALTNIATRQQRMRSIFLQSVRSMPGINDLFKMQCASMPKGQKETKANINPADVAAIWEQFRQYAMDVEYQETWTKVNAIVTERRKELVKLKRAESTYFLPASTKPGVVAPTGGYTKGVIGVTEGGATILSVGPSVSKSFPIVPVKK